MRRVLLFSVCLVAACRAERPGAPGLPAASARERPYRPPADGRLSERQLQAYVAFVRARPGATAREGDEEAVDTRRGGEEYVWVRQKVLEAELRIDERAAQHREIEVDRKTADALRHSAAASTDGSTREALQRQAGDLDRRSAEVERALKRPREAGEADNDALVARYRRQIESAGRRSP